jgi:hypothetical protein
MAHFVACRKTSDVVQSGQSILSRGGLIAWSTEVYHFIGTQNSSRTSGERCGDGSIQPLISVA